MRHRVNAIDGGFMQAYELCHMTKRMTISTKRTTGIYAVAVVVVRSFGRKSIS